MTKRLSPFSSETPQQLKTFVTTKHNATEEDLRVVYDRTLQLMMEGSSDVGPQYMGSVVNTRPYFKPSPSVDLKGKEKAKKVDIFCCSNCKSSNTGSVVRCYHCDATLCLSCVRQCNGCDLKFCSVCSVLNYDDSYVQTFCFDCM